MPSFGYTATSGTLLSDNPYTVLNTASDEQRAAADDFLAYLHEPDRQKRFTDAAFRSYEGEPGAALSRDNGVLPDATFTALDPPSSTVMAKALTSWDSQRKRARVLLVLDVSGSMAESTSTGKSKLELAKQAALKALDMFAPDDEVGLWTFSTAPDGVSNPYTEQVPIGAVSAVKGEVSQAISGMAPGGGTALYATTRAAQHAMRASVDPNWINAVVLLTDGKNEYLPDEDYSPDEDLDGLVDDLDASKLENPVRVFTIAYGDKADLSTLDRISTASRAAAYDARDPATIDNVFTNVISNF